MAEGPTPGRVALVHDFLLDVRGAERAFEALCALFPQADLFTAVYDEAGTEGRFAGRRIHTSGLQRLGLTSRTFRLAMPFYPAAIERLDLSDYPLVISSSSAWAHGAIASDQAVHLCYCHNPFRYAWSARTETLAATPLLLRPGLDALLRRWRTWDVTVARRVDRYVANSETTRRRIGRFFGRPADVLSPPVDTGRFAPGPVGDRYVVLSELMRHKRIDVAVRAATQLGLPLTVVGKGPDRRRLEALAGPSVEFTGHLPDPEVAKVLASARALVVTATEEFGIAAVEAQAAGRPVVALRAGGVLETVVEGETGVFYDVADPGALAAALRAFDALAVDPAACVASAQRFDVEHFDRGISAFVAEELARDRVGAPAALARRRRPRPAA